MRYLLIVMAVFGVAVAAATATGASAQGVSQSQLEDAGWDCPDVAGAIHCAPSGGLARVLTGEAETMTFLVFSNTDGEFLGTEQIIRADVFHGQPCPTDPPSGQYTDLGSLLGLPYFACHRYDSPF
jgi:hypothetical protein